MSKPKNFLSVMLEESPATCSLGGAIFMTYFAYALYGKDEPTRSFSIFASLDFLLLLVILFFAKLPNDSANSASKKIAERQEALERDVANAIKRDKELRA